ncbi:MAG: ribonuclease HII [Candidatus Dormibacteria bacterium]
MSQFVLSTYLTQSLDITYHPDLKICGIDEVGRGAFAGPLVACGVVFPASYVNPDLRDSKELSPARRTELATVVKRDALSYWIVEVPSQDIDAHGVGWANRTAFESILDALEADVFICDGNLKLASTKTWISLPKADQLITAASGASIIAKTHRDSLMEKFHEDAPMYFWADNKGYGSKAHRDAIRIHGLHSLHRRSFIHEDLREEAPLQLALFPSVDS